MSSLSSASLRLAVSTAALALSCWAQQAQAVELPLALSYTPANTAALYNTALGISVSADGKRLLARTTPFDGYNGGRLTLGGYPWYISVADFGSSPARAANGDRWRGTGALTMPTGKLYTVATLVRGTLATYQLTPVEMSGITRGYVGGWTGSMTGTLTTDGTRGKLTASNIVDFDIHVDGVETRN